jgi:hypothetical protein
MTIKQQGGIFGRNPTFNNLTTEGVASLDGPVVINDSGADVDFRVESDTQPNAIFVDGTNGHVGVGIANPPYRLVVSNGGAEGLEIGPGYLGGRTLFQNYNRATSAYVAAWEYASEYIWNIGGTEKMRLNTSGNLAMASGNGIDFSATSGTGTSELFSDYEEGRFDTVLTDTGATSTISLTRARCDYIKAGRMVHITGEVTISTITGTPTGDIQMTLPFANAASSQRSARSRRYIAMLSLAGAPTGVGEGFIESGATTMQLIKADNFAVTNIASNIQSGTTFVFDFTYQSAS